MGKSPTESRAGDVLGARYALDELLVTGEVYDTYHATDRKGGSKVVIKLLRPELALRAKVVDGFVSTPRTLIELEHPNVARVLAVESDETGIPFVVEERVEGEPLSRSFSGFGEGLPVGVAITMLAPVVEALEAAHARGLVHGRLDSEHVLLEKQRGMSMPKVIGIGAWSESGEVASERLAPELRAGETRPGARADVWAIGALLYEMLSGGQPGVSEREHVTLDEQAPHLPAELCQLVERCLSHDPKARFRDAGEVRVALSAVRDGLRAGAAPKAQPAAPAETATPSKREKTEQAARRELGLSATVFQRQSPAFQKRSPAARPASFGFDEVGDTARPAPPAAPDGEADEPEIVVEPVRPSLAPRLSALADRTEAERPSGKRKPPPVPPPRPQQSGPIAPASVAPEMKTLSDLAAAFGPMEGADRIGQAEVPPAAARPSKETPEPKAARVSAPTTNKGAVASQPRERPSKVAAPPPGSVKQLRQAAAVTGTQLSAEQIREARARVAAASGSRRRRIIEELLLFLFAFLLLFAIPLLWDPTRDKARAMFGERAQLAAAGLALLSVVVLVQTWALQVHARPFMLRPLTISLRVVTVAVCVLAASYMLPKGALGPAEAFARAALPWGSGFFYLAFGLYGTARGVREAGASPVVGIVVALMYSGGFVGSYRALATTVLTKSARARGAGGFSQLSASFAKLREIGHAKPEASDGGVAKPMSERHEVGASEAEDMRHVNEMQDSRKATGKQLDDVAKHVDKVAH